MPPPTLTQKLKVQLKLSISRLRMVQQKDDAISKQQRREMAQLLDKGKEESARIRVENIIRSDIIIELLEILELYCELLIARIGLMESKDCDPGLEEPVKSIIYAAPRTEIKELQQVRALLMEKYGKDFALQAVENSDGKVAERVLSRLRVEPPKETLVKAYLEEIARTYGVDWPKGRHAAEAAAGRGGEEEGDEDDEDDDDAPGGQKVKNLEAPLSTDELSRATPPRDFGPKSPVSITPQGPSTDNVSPKVKLPAPLNLKPGPKVKKASTSEGKSKAVDSGGGGKESNGPVGGKIPDVDDLQKRFAALSRK